MSTTEKVKIGCQEFILEYDDPGGVRIQFSENFLSYLIVRTGKELPGHQQATLQKTVLKKGLRDALKAIDRLDREEEKETKGTFHLADQSGGRLKVRPGFVDIAVISIEDRGSPENLFCIHKPELEEFIQRLREAVAERRP